MARSGVYFGDPKSSPQPPAKSHLIYVEGVDDANFVDRILIDQQADPAELGIIFTEGSNQLLPNLKILVKSSEYVTGKISRLAIFRDANGNPAQTMAALLADLAQLGLPQPAHGAFEDYDNGGRSLGVFLVPSNDTNGALEDLLMATVPTDPRLAAAAALIDTASAQHGALDHRSKRIMRAYLASCPIDASGCGRAYKNGWFDHTHQSLSALQNFVSAFCQL